MLNFSVYRITAIIKALENDKSEIKTMLMQIPIDNPELLTGLILVITSVVGLVGGNVVLGPLTLNLKTAEGKAYAFVLGVGLLGIVIILTELFGT